MRSKTGEITADASLQQAEKSAEYFRSLLTAHVHDGTDSVREADYKGHHIVITTTYQITIDGKPFTAGLGVSNDGSVHYHGMPNVGFDSAVDLVKAVIDSFSGEFGDEGDHDGDHGHDDHDHDGAHGHGVKIARARSPKKTAPKGTSARAAKQRRPATRTRR